MPHSLCKASGAAQRVDVLDFLAVALGLQHWCHRERREVSRASSGLDVLRAAAIPSIIHAPSCLPDVIIGRNEGKPSKRCCFVPIPAHTQLPLAASQQGAVMRRASPCRTRLATWSNVRGPGSAARHARHRRGVRGKKRRGWAWVQRCTREVIRRPKKRQYFGRAVCQLPRCKQRLLDEDRLVSLREGCTAWAKLPKGVPLPCLVLEIPSVMSHLTHCLSGLRRRMGGSRLSERMYDGKNGATSGGIPSLFSATSEPLISSLGESPRVQSGQSPAAKSGENRQGR